VSAPAVVPPLDDMLAAIERAKDARARLDAAAEAALHAAEVHLGGECGWIMLADLDAIRWRVGRVREHLAEVARARAAWRESVDALPGPAPTVAS
jgi:hypothetical protein